MARFAVLIFCLCSLLLSPARADEASAPKGPAAPAPAPAPAPALEPDPAKGEPARAEPGKGEPAGARPAARPAPPRREILLTFDDGPRLDLTPQVLDVLDQHNIKAVFFVNGWHFQGSSAGAERARELLREIVRRGHLVGNHTVHHYFLCGKRGPKIAAQEIEENAALIEQAIGMRPLLFRTPYGAHCKTLSATLQALGLKSTGWDIDPQDWKLRDTEKILTYVQGSLRRLKGRAIVLFHDVQPATVTALPQLLDWIVADNQARRAAGQPELKIIDYTYLLPEHPVVPPVIDGLGRVLIDAALTWPPAQLWQPLLAFLSNAHA